MYALINDNTVTKYPLYVNLWRVENPNTSLPATPTETQLQEVGIYEVMTTEQPAVDYTKNVTEGTPTLVNGVWNQTWTVTDATQSEIQTREAEAKAKNKQQAMQLLTDTDWTQMPDVNLLNKEEFIAYRAALRQIAINPEVNVIWPTKPSEQW